MKTNKASKPEVVISPEQFAQMNASEIVDLLKKNRNYAINGDILGQDRCIIKIG